METVRSDGEDVVVLFSGGTDSTLAAALCAETFRRVRLVTYSRFGIASVENSKVNAEALMDRFGRDKITHEIISVDAVFKYVSYENYTKNLLKHGFMNLSTCGLCKLSMHVRTVEYCLENGIRHVSDGANSGMTMFPDQMESVIEKLQAMYREFGITYSNPVFDYEPPEEKGFIDQSYVQMLSQPVKTESDFDKRDRAPKDGNSCSPKSEETKKVTSGEILYRMKLAPAPNVKGTPYDRARQPRCFQFILFNVFANKYFLNASSYDDYQASTLTFFSEKIDTCTRLLKAGDPGSSRLKKKLFGKSAK
jgi:predicted subunit of tRNA(5-methylaminomethyl-2-thiouridylate) methyltransferase